MALLICTVGLPYSGKSTWAKVQQCPVVCPDAIRLALHGQRFNILMEPYVWVIAKTMVRALFLAGHNRVILDATNTTEKRRAEWLSDDWDTQFKILDTPKEECISRAKRQNDIPILPVIEKMHEYYEPVTEVFLYLDK